MSLSKDTNLLRVKRKEKHIWVFGKKKNEDRNSAETEYLHDSKFTQQQ